MPRVLRFPAESAAGPVLGPISRPNSRTLRLTDHFGFTTSLGSDPEYNGSRNRSGIPTANAAHKPAGASLASAFPSSPTILNGQRHYRWAKEFAELHNTWNTLTTDDQIAALPRVVERCEYAKNRLRVTLAPDAVDQLASPVGAIILNA